MGFELFDGAVVKDKIISHGDGATFFHVLDFAVVALADGLGIEGAVGAFRNAFITHGFRDDDGEEGEATREFMLKSAIFGPRIEPVENNALLASFDEVFGLGNGLAGDPILAFGRTDHFAKGFFAFAIHSAFDAALGHFLINHVAEVDFGIAEFGEIINSYGFAAAAHADDGENFNILCFHKDNYSIGGDLGGD